jgi:signal peptidase I
MATSSAAALPAGGAEEAPQPRRTSTPLFVSALLARTWLWFIAGCVVVTLLPMLLGWRPYVVESGSMTPRIDVGDVVLAAPESDPQALLGRVTVFDDPEMPGRVKTHRVMSINDDGSLVTKGDANPTPDTQPIQIDDVRGLGRLLVSFVGLPMVWVKTGQWLWFGLFLLSVLVAAWLVGKDKDGEDDEPTDPEDGDKVVPLPERMSTGGSTQIAASNPPADPGRGGRMSRVMRGGVLAAVGALVLGVPTTSAAFAATTVNRANSWSVPTWNYTTSVMAYSPFLYWKLDETSGATAADTSGNSRTGTYTNSNQWTRSVVGALTGDTPNRAVTSTNANACIYSSTGVAAVAAPQQMTSIVWFRSNTNNGGKLLGFEAPRTGVASPGGGGGTYDRHLYMDGQGRVWFGVYNNGYFTISSGTGLNDNAWHMAAATMGPSGMALYIDGVLVDTDPNTTGEATTGWWRAGCGNLSGWGTYWGGGNNPGTDTGSTANRGFLGSLDEVTVETSVLTATQIYNLYLAR